MRCVLVSLLGCASFLGCGGGGGGNPDAGDADSPPSPHAPVADAGSDQTVGALSLVALDGTGSSDPDGDPISFAWEQVSGESVLLSSATAATPTFLAPDQGDLVFSLVVSDGEYDSLADTVTVRVVTRSGERPTPDLVFASPQGLVEASDPRDVVLRGNEAFVADGGDGLVVYDVPAVDAATRRGSAGPGLTRVRVQGDVAVGEIDSTSDGTVLFDISGEVPAPLMQLGNSVDASMAGDGTYLYVVGRGIVWTVDARLSPPAVVGAVETGAYELHLALDGDRLYATNRDGLLVFDRSDPTSPAQVGAWAPAAGFVGAVWARDSVAFMVVGSTELQAVDTSDPEHPSLLGSVTLTEPKDMAFSETHAFVTDDSSGVRVLDLSGASPSLVATYDTPSDAEALVLVGDTLAVAVNSAAVLLDVSLPEAPALASTLDSIHPQMVELVGDGVVAFENDLVDASDPWAPTVVGTIPYTTYNANIQVVGSTFFGLKSPSALEVVDVSDPSTPVITATVLLPMTYGSADLFGSFMYAFFQQDFSTFGLDVIDLSSPAVPLVLGRVATTEPWGRAFVSDAGDVFAQAELIDVSDPTAPVTEAVGRVGWPAEAHGLEVASISSGFVELVDFAEDPYDESLAGFWGEARDIAWAGSLLVATTEDSHADPGDRLGVIDVSDLGAPSFVSHTALPGHGVSVAVDERRVAVVLEGEGIWLGEPPMEPFDIAQGRTGASLGTGGGPFLALAGDHGLALANGGTVALVDASDPSAPAVVSTYDAQAFLWDMHSADARLYLTVSETISQPATRIDIVDVSDLEHPVKLGEHEVTGVQDLAARGDVLYLALGADGLQVVDVSSPEAPQEIATATTRAALLTLLLGGTRLYGNGVVIDVSVPSDPSVVESLAGWSAPFALLGNLLVDAGSGDTLRVFDVSEPQSVAEIGSLALPGELEWRVMTGPWPIQVDGNWAWIALSDPNAAPGGVRFVAVDLSLPAHPMPVASFQSEARHASFVAREGVVWTMTYAGVTRDSAQVAAVRTLRGAITLREDRTAEEAGAQLTYHLDFTQPDASWPPRLRCAVTAGSCTAGPIDPAEHTAEVTWDLPAAPGEAELAVVVGNERWAAVATDWLTVE